MVACVNPGANNCFYIYYGLLRNHNGSSGAHGSSFTFNLFTVLLFLHYYFLHSCSLATATMFSKSRRMLTYRSQFLFVEKFYFACFMAVLSVKAQFLCKYVISSHFRTFYLSPIIRLAITYGDQVLF